MCRRPAGACRSNRTRPADGARRPCARPCSRSVRSACSAAPPVAARANPVAHQPGRHDRSHRGGDVDASEIGPSRGPSNHGEASHSPTLGTERPRRDWATRRPVRARRRQKATRARSASVSAHRGSNERPSMRMPSTSASPAAAARSTVGRTARSRRVGAPAPRACLGVAGPRATDSVVVIRGAGRLCRPRPVRARPVRARGACRCPPGRRSSSAYSAIDSLRARGSWSSTVAPAPSTVR